MNCPKCKTRNMVRVEMTVGRREVIHLCCSYCDMRWWEDAAANRIELVEILELAANP